MSGLMTDRNSLLVLGNHCFHTVDGRNLAPVDMENIPLFTRFYTFQVVSRISEPSTVSPKFLAVAHEGLEAEGGPNRGSWKQDGKIERRIQFGSSFF